MILRDYKYVDVHKVESYLSSLPAGVIEELKETTRDTSGREGKGGAKAVIFSAEGKLSSQEETTRESTIKITSQRMFHQLYEALEQVDAIAVFDEDDPAD